jgi:hypothetical protein
LLTVACLVLSDLLALSAATGVAVWLTATSWLAGEGSPASLGLIVPLMLGAYGVAGLYPAVGIGPVGEMRRLSRTTLGVTVIVLAAFTVAGLGTWWAGALGVGLLALVAVPVARAGVRACAHSGRGGAFPSSCTEMAPAPRRSYAA